MRRTPSEPNSKVRGQDKDAIITIWGEEQGLPEPTLLCISPMQCQAKAAVKAANAAAKAVGAKVRWK